MSTDNTDPWAYGPYDFGNECDTLTLATKITANNEGARKWFGHGLAWMYGCEFRPADHRLSPSPQPSLRYPVPATIAFGAG